MAGRGYGARASPQSRSEAGAATNRFPAGLVTRGDPPPGGGCIVLQAAGEQRLDRGGRAWAELLGVDVVMPPRVGRFEASREHLQEPIDGMQGAGTLRGVRRSVFAGLPLDGH